MSISNFGAAGVRPGVCTSTTRPTAPYTGQIIYETDTKAMLVWGGSAWEPFGDVRIFSSSAARASAIPTPIEGLVTYLQDVDELEVYNGSSWLRLVVTSDDEGLTINGNLFSNTGNVRMNRAGGDTATTKGGLEFVIDGTTYARLYQSAAGTLETDANLKIVKRNPVFEVRETGGTDNVDIFLGQNGTDSEGLRIRYESSTGNSYMRNVFANAGIYAESQNFFVRNLSNITNMSVDSAGNVSARTDLVSGRHALIGGYVVHDPIYAFVEGPTSGGGTGILQFTGSRLSSSSDFFTVGQSGISINRSGYYRVDGAFRVSGADNFAFLGISGNRSTLEDRSDSGWTHDHASYVNQHTHSNYIGFLSAGWTVTLGASNGNITYNSTGWAGYIFIHKIGDL